MLKEGIQAKGTHLLGGISACLEMRSPVRAQAWAVPVGTEGLGVGSV